MHIIHSIEDFKSLEAEIGRCRMGGYTFLYRGQANSSWLLQTTLYRHLGGTIMDDGVWEKYIDTYNRFKEYAISRGYLDWKHDTEDVDFYLLSTARHLGFYCHLLDWSGSLNIATLFACSEEPQVEGALWVLSTRQRINQTPITFSPFDVDTPRSICKEYDLISDKEGMKEMPLGRIRRLRQRGFLSIVPRDSLASPFAANLCKEYGLVKFIIPPEAKVVLKEYLNSQGENLKHLYGQPTDEEEKVLSFIETLHKTLKQ